MRATSPTQKLDAAQKVRQGGLECNARTQLGVRRRAFQVEK